MIRRPPRSTRTDTLFPYTTLFLSQPGFIASMPVYRKGKQVAWVNANFHAQAFMEGLLGKGDGALSFEVFDGADNDQHSLLYATAGLTADEASGFPWTAGRGGIEVVTTETPRVGEECFSTRSSRCSPLY